MEQSRILIIDDNPEIREIIHILLKGEGFLVTEAPDGATALALLTSCEFDLIILDIMMPAETVIRHAWKSEKAAILRFSS